MVPNSGNFGAFVLFSLRTLVVCFVLSMVLPSANAQMTTYTYNGHAYNSTTHVCNGTYVPCTQLAVSGSFTVAQPLGANLSAYYVAPSTFSFNDGAISLTPQDALAFSTFEVWTNANGNIVNWNIVLAVSNPSGCLDNNELIGSYGSPPPPNGNGQSGDYSCYQSNHGDADQAFGAGGNANVPGTWTGGSACQVTDVPVMLPPVTVQSPLSFLKSWVISYGAISLNFVTDSSSNSSVVCEAQASGTLPVYFDFVHMFNSQANVTLSVFKPGTTGALQSCSFSFIGGENNQCILNGTYDPYAYYMRWFTPGFQTLVALGNVPTGFNTGALTFWVSLGDLGYSMTSAVTSVEPYIHATLINNLPELPGAFYTIIQDPGSVNVAVVSSSGLTAGILPNGQVTYGIPLSFVYQSATAPAVVLGNVGAGQYLVILTGISSGDYELGVSTQEGANASPQETASGYIEQGASVGYTVTISTTSGGITQTISPATIALTSGNNCDGTYTGTFKGNVTVMTGQTCILVGGAITGNITQNGGSLVMSHSTVRGNVQINGGGTFSIGPLVTINGNLEIHNLPAGSAADAVCGATIQGNMEYQNSAAAIQIGNLSTATPPCAGNMIGGNLEVQNNTGETFVDSNTVIGNLTTQNNTAFTWVDGNMVGGNLQDQGNTGGTDISNDTVGNNLQCQNNSAPISGGGDTAKQHQCYTY